jgi:hypothetical protein
MKPLSLFKMFVYRMKPLSSEEIIFINSEESSNCRKGVTVSKIKTSQGEEIRIAIWNIVAVEGGFLTPKSSGISLKTQEYEELLNKTGEIRNKVQHLSVNTLDEVLASFSPDDALYFLREKISQLEKGAKKSPPSGCEDSNTSPSTSSTSSKKKRKLDNSSSS